MPQLAWYLKRLRVMRGREILHRLGQQVTLLSLHAEYRLAAMASARRLPETAKLHFCTTPAPQLPPLTFDREGLRRAAPDLLKGMVPVFGRHWQWHPTPDTWHRAPDTGRCWPQRFFAGISYRDGNPFGDIRQLWEPSRLQHLVDIAAIALISGPDEQRRAVSMVTSQLASWDADNPPLTGAHYVSAMECALRLMALCHAMDMLRSNITDNAPWDALNSIVNSHAPLIARRLSLHSSTGNHTTAEAAALVYAGLLFPELRGAEHWLSTGLGILQAQSESQVLTDGGGLEQAFTYHRFNIQLLGLVEALLIHHDQDVPSTISGAVARGNGFLRAMAKANGELPVIGDSDGGCALSRYLMPQSADTEAKPPVYGFQHSGYTVAQISLPSAIRFIFDHGPLGMPPAFGHGHADSLSLLLTAGDEELLVDTGTYTYTGDQQWRQFFRGTRAHNTVTVNNADQARQEACFLWSSPFRTRVIASAMTGGSGGRLLATHDGYRQYGVRHIRGIAWVQDQWLLVQDYLEGECSHRLELHWHLGKEPIWREVGIFELQTAGGLLTCQLKGGFVSCHRGEQEPLMGWRSPAYGELEPITTIRVLHDGDLPHTFTTLIRLPGKPQADNSIQEALKWMMEQVRSDRNG